MTRTWAAIGALMLAMSAGRALAGGYWDAGEFAYDDTPAAQDSDCDRPCPPCPDWREAHHAWREGWDERDGWREREGWRQHEGWREGRQVFLPSEFFEGGGGVGPDVFVEDSGGGGGFVDEGAFAGARAAAFASASASARVRVSIHAHNFMHHQMMMHHMKPPMGHKGHGRW